LGSSIDGQLQGKLNHFANDGSPLNTLFTNSGAFQENGPCFDAARNLFTTNFEGNSLSKFNPDGSLDTSAYATDLNLGPYSCIFDHAGNLYVGLVDRYSNGDGLGGLWRRGANGTVTVVHPDVTDPNQGGNGVSWIDLAADGCTLF